MVFLGKYLPWKKRKYDVELAGTTLNSNTAKKDTGFSRCFYPIFIAFSFLFFLVYVK